MEKGAQWRGVERSTIGGFTLNQLPLEELVNEKERTPPMFKKNRKGGMRG